MSRLDPQPSPQVTNGVHRTMHASRTPSVRLHRANDDDRSTRTLSTDHLNGMEGDDEDHR